MSEVANQYIGAEILIPGGDQLERGHVVACNHDANGNVLGKDHAIFILDNRLDQVEFAYDEFTELTINVIAKSVYTQFDANGNMY